MRTRRYNQMEISMDKFLAKKNPIFKQISLASGSIAPQTALATQPDAAQSEKQDFIYSGFGVIHAD